MEAIVVGALRREQAADDAKKRLTAEIDQLGRLVSDFIFVSHFWVQFGTFSMLMDNLKS